MMANGTRVNRTCATRAIEHKPACRGCRGSRGQSAGWLRCRKFNKASDMAVLQQPAVPQHVPRVQVGGILLPLVRHVSLNLPSLPACFTASPQPQPHVQRRPLPVPDGQHLWVGTLVEQCGAALGAVGARLVTEVKVVAGKGTQQHSELGWKEETIFQGSCAC